ncbi:MAG: nitroreductase family deazaflavin-dependent oxidoreductase [Catenulispora sp.]
MTNPWSALLTRLGRRRWFATVFKPVAPRVDRFLGLVTGGRVFLLTGTGRSTLLLTTTGRKSGQPRTVPLLYAERGGAYVVVGSNWGGQRHPAWALNLLAEPEATVLVRGRVRTVRARVMAGDEREAVWTTVMTKLWPGYDDYAERSGRDINVFALEPV